MDGFMCMTAFGVSGMASLRLSPYHSGPTSQSILGFRNQVCVSHNLAITKHQPEATVSSTTVNFRFKNAIGLQGSQRLLVLSASKNNHSDADSLKERADGIKTDETAQGPPFLTILAGVIVFLVICWIIGSIVTWLIGLIVHSLPSK